MSELVETVRWTVRQHWWLTPIALAAAIAAGWLGYDWSKPQYIHWRSERALVQAREFLRRNDLPRTEVALQVALRGGPTVEAFRLLGDFDEACGSAQAVNARQLAAQLSPGDRDLQLDWARTALRFTNLAVAREALESLPPSARTGLDYQRVEASYALLAGEWSRAARLLTALKLAYPGDANLRLLDDSLNLHNADQRQAERARADLENFSAASPQRLPALRALLSDAYRRRQSFSARQAGRALAAAPGATFGDLLDAAAAESLAGGPSGIDAPLRSKLLARASVNSAAAAQYGRWLLHESRADEAADWVARLPSSVAAAPGIAELRAEIATVRSDWNGLRPLLKLGAWGPILDRGLECGFAARILRERGDGALARDTWAEALRECADSQSSLRALARLADVWKWPDAMQQALFAAVQSFPGDQVATEYLIGLLRARRDTPGLLNLLTLRKGAAALSDRQLADWALLSLLVSPATKPDAATQLLDKLYAQHRSDPYIAADRALGLWELGRVTEACALADGLTPEDRNYAPRTPILAVVYAAAGRKTDAQAMLIRAPGAAQLLPEEAALLSRAAALINP